MAGHAGEKERKKLQPIPEEADLTSFKVFSNLLSKPDFLDKMGVLILLGRDWDKVESCLNLLEEDTVSPDDQLPGTQYSIKDAIERIFSAAGTFQTVDGDPLLKDKLETLSLVQALLKAAEIAPDKAKNILKNLGADEAFLSETEQVTHDELPTKMEAPKKQESELPPLTKKEINSIANEKLGRDYQDFKKSPLTVEHQYQDERGDVFLRVKDHDEDPTANALSISLLNAQKAWQTEAARKPINEQAYKDAFNNVIRLQELLQYHDAAFNRARGVEARGESKASFDHKGSAVPPVRMDSEILQLKATVIQILKNKQKRANSALAVQIGFVMNRVEEVQTQDQLIAMLNANSHVVFAKTSWLKRAPENTKTGQSLINAGFKISAEGKLSWPEKAASKEESTVPVVKDPPKNAHSFWCCFGKNNKVADASHESKQDPDSNTPR